MAKFTYKEIKEIIESTDKQFHNWSRTDFSSAGYGYGLTIGYYQAANSNWAYRVVVYVDKENNTPFEVVQVFGQTQTK